MLIDKSMLYDRKINHRFEMILAYANELKNNWAAGKKLEKPFGENV